jgi:CHASE3 domain sensor protein
MINKHIKILHQLLFAAIISVALVGVMGVMAYLQTNRMYHETTKLYNNSLEVRRAIGELKTSILSIHRTMKDLFLFTVEEDMQRHLSEIAHHKSDIAKQLDIIEQHYLGDPKNIETIHSTFLRWNTLREETVRLRQLGVSHDAAKRTRSDGVAGSMVEELMAAITVVDQWSLTNANKLFRNTEQHNTKLNQQIVILLVVFMVFLGLVFTMIYRSIRHPLGKLSIAATNIRSGNYSTRCNYHSSNEFGRLSQDFNSLAETIEQTMTLNERSSGLAFKMLQNHNPDVFFNDLLQGLMTDTGSQQGVIYLLHHEQNLFKYKASIGGSQAVRQSFDPTLHEGEIGQALATKEIIYLTGLSDNSRFVFNTSEGYIIPAELISIPIVAGGDTLAMITLANVSHYTELSKQYLQKVYPVLCARVAGILAFMRMEKLTAILETKNRELELQSHELSQQSIELEQQNLELESQKVQLQEASLLKTSFLSNMSHELRTPLNSVISLSGLLHRRMEGVLSSEEHGYLGIIERNGKRLLELINDILNISKIESGKVEVNLSEFDLSELLDELIQILDPQAKSKGLNLEIAPKAIGLRIYSDRKKSDRQCDKIHR